MAIVHNSGLLGHSANPLLKTNNAAFWLFAFNSNLTLFVCNYTDLGNFTLAFSNAVLAFATNPFSISKSIKYIHNLTDLSYFSTAFSMIALAWLYPFNFFWILNANSTILSEVYILYAFSHNSHALL